MAPFMLVSTVGIQFIVAVKTLPTEAALRMALEAALVHSTRVVIAELLVLV
jgi:hypothetical protein